MKKVTTTGAMLLLAACSMIAPTPEPPPIAVAAPTMRTVPPKTPTPVAADDSRSEATPAMRVVTKESQDARAEENKLKVRPIKNPETEKALKAKKTVGPIITHAGVVRADGDPTEPVGKKNGIPVYTNYVGSGFMIVIEAKPGFSNLEVGRSIFRYDPEDPKKRPDLEIQVDKPLGDGSDVVCDARPPKFGGVPAISPASFAETQKVSAALNDFSCRFETFIESDASCTNAPNGDFRFVNHEESKVQFCMVVARKWNFPVGDTTVSVRLRDREGHPGPVSKFVLRRLKRPTPPPYVPPTATPTPVRRRK